MNAIKKRRSILSALCGFLTGLSLLTPGVSPAQEKEIIRGNQVWLQYYGQATLNPRWSLQLDGGMRWKDDFREISAYIVRSSIGYAPAPKLRLAAGVAHLGFYVQDTLSRVEFRPYQDFQVTQPFRKLSLVHRLRLEERLFFPVLDGRIQSTDRFSFRLRYAAFVRIPLFRLSKENPDAQFVLELGDELFLNFGPQVTHTHFDQNRLLVSPTFRFNPSFALALTWNNQFASTPVPSVYAHTQVFWLQLRQQFDFGKKSLPAD